MLYSTCTDHEACIACFLAKCTHVFVTDSANYPCRGGELEIVKYLIEVQGCSAGCTDNRGQTPLHLACQ